LEAARVDELAAGGDAAVVLEADDDVALPVPLEPPHAATPSTSTSLPSAKVGAALSICGVSSRSLEALPACCLRRAS
jgi:hypothetical protein